MYEKPRYIVTHFTAGRGYTTCLGPRMLPPVRHVQIHYISSHKLLFQHRVDQLLQRAVVLLQNQTELVGKQHVVL